MTAFGSPDLWPKRPALGVSGRGIAGVYRGYCRMKPEAFGGAWEVAAEGISAALNVRFGRRADVGQLLDAGVSYPPNGPNTVRYSAMLS